MSDSEDLDLSLDSVFPEPPRPPTPEPTTSTYTRDSRYVRNDADWTEIRIRLVGDHPLWGHYLWNAARSFATYLDSHPEMYKDKNVLELGAGGALPSLVTAKNGAGAVVITDYPDKSLIENIDYNVQSNLTSEEQKHVSSKGYIWGQPTSGLLDCEQPKFDLVILSDLIFNHSQHDALLSTCESVIRSDASQVLVFYSHHRPHLAHRDMLFFEKAKERQWEVEKVVEEKFPPMFPEDPGDEDVRATVHGWRLTRTGGMKTT